MKIAIPVADGKLCAHFGHCQHFALISVDPENNDIVSNETLTPPVHEPGVLPRWLSEQGATTIISGGMGQMAQNFFRGYGIEVVVGAFPDYPENVAKAYIDGNLEAGNNVCDH